jgi:hypothetical protein
LLYAPHHPTGFKLQQGRIPALGLISWTRTQGGLPPEGDFLWAFVYAQVTETFFPSSSLQAGWWRPIHLLHGETRSGGSEPFQVKHKVRETPRNSQRESKHAESRLPPLSPADRHRYCARVREPATSFFFDVLTPCRALDSSSASLHASAPTGLFSSFIVSPRTPPLTTAHRSTVAAGTPPLTIA